jgi:hypothetical protein
MTRQFSAIDLELLLALHEADASRLHISTETTIQEGKIKVCAQFVFSTIRSPGISPKWLKLTRKHPSGPCCPVAVQMICLPFASVPGAEIHSPDKTGCALQAYSCVQNYWRIADF